MSLWRRLWGGRKPLRRVLLAFDSFGGSMSAPDACERAAARLRQGGVEARMHPLSDGGEGLLQTLAAHGPVRRQTVATVDALGQPRQAELGWKGDEALVESAEAIGLRLLAQRRPLDASSAGLGPLLRASGDAAQVTLGLGGSATVDGGLGLLLALGLVAEDDAGNSLSGPPLALLPRARRLTGAPVRLPPTRVLVDVRTRVADATARFGPQKGLDAAGLAATEASLDHLASLLVAWAHAQGRDLDPDLPGGGAAGGLGLACAALGWPLLEGAEVVAERTGLDRALDGVDAVVLGEGRLDRTSLEGKVASAVLRRARARGLPVLALVGSVQDGADADLLHVEQTGAVGDAPFLAACDRLATRLLAGA